MVKKKKKLLEGQIFQSSPQTPILRKRMEVIINEVRAYVLQGPEKRE